MVGDRALDRNYSVECVIKIYRPWLDKVNVPNEN